MLASQKVKGENNGIVRLSCIPHNDPGTVPGRTDPNCKECRGKDPEASRREK